MRSIHITKCVNLQFFQNSQKLYIYFSKNILNVYLVKTYIFVRCSGSVEENNIADDPIENQKVTYNPSLKNM